MCHILTPVCRCGPGHRCRCNLSGPILVLGQIFFACVCMQQPCVCVCRGMWSYGLLDQTVPSGMWLGQLAVFQYPPLFLHAVVFCQVCERRWTCIKVIFISSVWHEDGMKASVARWYQFFSHLRWCLTSTRDASVNQSMILFFSYYKLRVWVHYMQEEIQMCCWKLPRSMQTH